MEGSTPAPIDTPEETGKRIALSGGSITLPFDIESEEDPVPVQFHSRKKLAAQIADAIRAALASSNAEIERLRKRLDLARQNRRDTFEAMVAMRNTINEHVPLPSLESDLLQGPEDSVFCAAVAEAVVTNVAALTAQVGRMREALEPFMKAARMLSRPSDVSDAVLLRLTGAAQFLTHGDLRRLAALSPTEPEGKT